MDCNLRNNRKKKRLIKGEWRHQDIKRGKKGKRERGREKGGRKREREKVIQGMVHKTEEKKLRWWWWSQRESTVDDNDNVFHDITIIILGISFLSWCPSVFCFFSFRHHWRDCPDISVVGLSAEIITVSFHRGSVSCLTLCLPFSSFLWLLFMVFFILCFPYFPWLSSYDFLSFSFICCSPPECFSSLSFLYCCVFCHIHSFHPPCFHASSLIPYPGLLSFLSLSSLFSLFPLLEPLAISFICHEVDMSLFPDGILYSLEGQTNIAEWMLQ